MLDACEFFECEPWIGIYVETTGGAEVYLTSLEHYDSKYLGNRDNVIHGWKMNGKSRQQ